MMMEYSRQNDAHLIILCSMYEWYDVRMVHNMSVYVCLLIKEQKNFNLKIEKTSKKKQSKFRYHSKEGSFILVNEIKSLLKAKWIKWSVKSFRFSGKWIKNKRTTYHYNKIYGNSFCTLISWMELYFWWKCQELNWREIMGSFLLGKVFFCNEQPFVIIIAQINFFIISQRLLYGIEWIFDGIFEMDVKWMQHHIQSSNPKLE